MRGFPGLLLIFLLSSSLCYGIAKTVEVVGFGECADCKENNIKTSQVLSGTMNYFAYDFMHFFHCMFVSWDNTCNVFHIINSVWGTYFHTDVKTTQVCSLGTDTDKHQILESGEFST